MNHTSESMFMNLADACKATGVSTYYLRRGCINGSVPHIKSGKKFYVNVPALLEKLDRESRNNGSG